MITEEFLEMTDTLIKHVKEYPVATINGEFLVAKQPLAKQTKGGIILTEDHTRMQGYFQGFARVIMTPTSPFKAAGGELPIEDGIKVGDFVIFTHTARYKPAPQVLNFILDKEVEEKEVKDQYASEYSDVGILFLVPQADIKMVRDGYSVYRQVKQI